MKRILLKLSGEALAGQGDFGIDPVIVGRIAREIQEVAENGTQVAVVLGGGNLFRGAELQEAGMDRVTGDHMGMMATVMNALAFRDMLRTLGLGAQVFSALKIATIAEGYSRDGALLAMEQGPDRYLCCRHWQPLFYHRFCGLPARHRNSRRCCAQGHESRWRVQRRSNARQHCRAVRYAQLQ